jgi:hypothetical protein
MSRRGWQSEQLCMVKTSRKGIVPAIELSRTRSPAGQRRQLPGQMCRLRLAARYAWARPIFLHSILPFAVVVVLPTIIWTSAFGVLSHRAGWSPGPARLALFAVGLLAFLSAILGLLLVCRDATSTTRSARRNRIQAQKTTRTTPLQRHRD